MKRQCRDRIADIQQQLHSNSKCKCRVNSLHLLSWYLDIYDRLQGHHPYSSNVLVPQPSHLSKTKEEVEYHKLRCRQIWTIRTNSSNFYNSTSSYSNNKTRWVKYLAQDSQASSSNKISRWPQLSMSSSSKQQLRRQLPSFNNSKLPLDRRSERKAVERGWLPEQMQMSILTDVMKTYSVPS